MSALRKYFHTLSSSLDGFVGRFENHEALVAAAIAEMQKANAKMYVQINFVRTDAKKLEQRLLELRDSEQKWQDRALRTAEQDRNKALECLRRKKLVEIEKRQTEGQIMEQSVVIEKLEAEAKKIELRLQDLKRKKNTLTAKQFQAQAFGHYLEGQESFRTDVEDVLERWERNVATAHVYESRTDEDSFEAVFLSEEQRIELDQELNELLQK